jgi:hypothetical protein
MEPTQESGHNEYDIKRRKCAKPKEGRKHFAR